MSRPIEFRLYDEEAGVHSDPFDPFNMLGVVYWPDGREPTPINFCNHYIKEQFTGLHDKNGNMIFDRSRIVDGDGHLCTVVWDGEQGQWMTQSDEDFEFESYEPLCDLAERCTIHDEVKG